MKMHVCVRRGTRQPAIPVPAGGSAADAEARLAIGQIIAALEAHGLVESL
jgi:hypothetical protein